MFDPFEANDCSDDKWKGIEGVGVLVAILLAWGVCIFTFIWIKINGW